VRDRNRAIIVKGLEQNMNQTMHISFIGGGNMASAILCGLKNHAYKMSSICVVEPDAEKRAMLAEQFGVQTATHINDMPSSAPQVLVLAVKPQQMQAVCAQLNEKLSAQLKEHLIISIAAGIRTKDLGRWLNGHQAVVRAMPNTPAQIQVGVSALYAMPSVNSTQREQASSILQAVGSSLWLDNEEKMDAVTAISGSGPAYVFYLIEALQEAAVELGLSPEEAKLLALETFTGASLLAKQTKADIQTLRAQVTSKGGTTEQGILSLESAHIKTIILAAATAAAKKSKTLGDELAA
jgi:pyrroline-5-carboxylate reductase